MTVHQQIQDLLRQLRDLNPCMTGKGGRACTADWRRDSAWYRACDALDRLATGAAGDTDALEHFLDGAKFMGQALASDLRDAHEREEDIKTM